MTRLPVVEAGVQRTALKTHHLISPDIVGGRNLGVHTHLIKRVSVEVPGLLIVSAESGLEAGGDLDVRAALDLHHVTVTVDRKALVPAACLPTLVASKDSFTKSILESNIGLKIKALAKIY